MLLILQFLFSEDSVNGRYNKELYRLRTPTPDELQLYFNPSLANKPFS